MKLNTIGFAGSGRISRIIIRGLKNAGALPGKIIVTDTNAEATQKLKVRFPEITVNEKGLAGFEQADLIFLAVHPPVLMNVAAELKPLLKPDTIVCSLAPKITIEKISLALGGHGRIARMNPNAPSIANAGFNPISFSAAFPAPLKKEFIDFIGALGACPEVEEKKLEAFAVVSAMGPTYLWFQLFTLVDLAKRFGLAPQEALAAVSAMAAGAGMTMLKSDLTAEEILDLIPAKPLGEHENEIIKMYETKLTAMYSKMTT
jgi:pyrroline-5-carboxylate reductase